MTLESVRRALRSNEPNVLIEAPAGCGKTYEAAELAAEVGTQLPEGAQVLVLAHTNAAVQEFSRRIRNTGARVRATTIDAFCLDLLIPYAPRLNLPSPLQRNVGLGDGRLAFHGLAPATSNLLSRCPSVAAMLAFRYPIVILDEHQDTNQSQHRVVSLFRESECCRTRVFGDPMQAIYEDATGERVSWDQLLLEATTIDALDTGQRWSKQADLGEWILHARTELKAGRPIPFGRAPPSVRLIRLPGARCAGFGHGNVSVLRRPIQEFVRSSQGSATVLSRHNNHVWGLHIAAAGLLRLNEGADYADAYDLLEQAIAAVGNPSQLAMCIVAHLGAVSTGLDQAKRRAVERALRPDRIEYGRHQRLREFLGRFEGLYHTPDLLTFLATAKTMIAEPPSWLTVRMPVTMRLLAQVRPSLADNGLECLDEVVRRLKAGARRLTRSVSTIHKAKGLDFDDVLVANFSAGHFGDDEMSRRVAYVALSRARKSLTVLVPGGSPSPLIG
jgi:superfamily I DNA/RNA helicase